MENLDDFVKHYLIAALWSSNDESDESGGNPMDANYSLSDIAPETLAQAKADCERFQAVASDLLPLAYTFYHDAGMAGHPDAGSPQACAGHDFWLTRNGHGVGFWDRGMPDGIGEKLSALVGHGTDFPGVDLYIGDDGKIHG